MGFYDELIYTINHFRENSRKNAIYLLLFLLGVAAGAVAFSSVILYFLSNFSLPTMLLFMGLLTGITPLIYSKSKGSSSRIALREIVFAVLSFLALLALSRGFNTTAVNPEEALGAMDVSMVLYIFLAGIIGGATLVVPGLSGAFILLIMGLYPFVIYSISSIVVFLRDMSNISLFQDICIVLLPFGIGALIGCLVMARLMEMLVRNFPKTFYAAILGLILASVITLLQGPFVNLSGASVISLIAGIITFCTGAVAAYFMGKKQR